jgi:hypothetical protein
MIWLPPPPPLASVSSTGDPQEDWEREIIFWRKRGDGVGLGEEPGYLYIIKYSLPSLDVDAAEGANPLCKNTIAAFWRRFEERRQRDMKQSLKPKCSSKRKIVIFIFFPFYLWLSFFLSFLCWYFNCFNRSTRCTFYYQTVLTMYLHTYSHITLL